LSCYRLLPAIGRSERDRVRIPGGLEIDTDVRGLSSNGESEGIPGIHLGGDRDVVEVCVLDTGEGVRTLQARFQPQFPALPRKDELRPQPEITEHDVGLGRARGAPAHVEVRPQHRQLAGLEQELDARVDRSEVHAVYVELSDAVELGEPDHAGDPQAYTEGSALDLGSDRIPAEPAVVENLVRIELRSLLAARVRREQKGEGRGQRQDHRT
jgi:hypothetical protein